MTLSKKIEEDLFQDKDLFSVYRKTWSLSQNRFDLIVKSTAAFCLICFIIYVPCSRNNLFPVVAKSVTSWLAMGFNYSITILGFLIAGFTIFATMTRVEIFIALTTTQNKQANISNIKFIFYSFLRVFIVHVLLIFVCVVTTMLKDSSTIYLSALIDNELLIIQIKKMFVLLLLPIVGYLLISAVLQLKTFVWNLYQSIIIAVAGSVTLYEIEKLPP